MNLPAQQGKERYILNFHHCFAAATAAIDAEYMLLRIAGGPAPIFRERVYCYELYHQLRVQMGDNFGYFAGGEVDKGGHPLMNAPGIRNAKPDILIHQPGDMDGNLIVIEVKPISVVHRTAIRKDLQTLTAFMQAGHYARALYLVYGDGPQQLTKIISKAHTLQQERPDPPIDLRVIQLFWHRKPCEPARYVPWMVDGIPHRVL